MCAMGNDVLRGREMEARDPGSSTADRGHAEAGHRRPRVDADPTVLS
jgi:hypothetical protein